MKAGRTTTFVENARTQAQLLPVIDKASGGVSFLCLPAAPSPEKEAVFLSGLAPTAAKFQVLSEFSGHREGKRHEARLMEFGRLNPEKVLFLIDVGKFESRQLSSP